MPYTGMPHGVPDTAEEIRVHSDAPKKWTTIRYVLEVEYRDESEDTAICHFLRSLKDRVEEGVKLQVSDRDAVREVTAWAIERGPTGETWHEYYVER